MSRGHGRGIHNLDLVLKCAAGFEDVVARALAGDCPQLHLLDVDAGFLRASVGRSAFDHVRRLPYLSWAGIGLDNPARARTTDPATAVRNLDPTEVEWALSLSRRASFRFRFFQDGRLVSVDSTAVRAAIRTIEAHAPLLRHDPRAADVEVWILRRRGASTFESFVRPVDERRSTRGSLDDDVAAALVRVFDPTEDDVVFDPFAGRGTIPAARTPYPATWIGGCDIAPPRPSFFPVGRANLFSGTQIHRYLAGRRVNAVVSDLPWGHHDTGLDVRALYDRLPGCLLDIGDPPIRCTFLAPRDDALVTSLASSLLLVDDPRHVLIHGRKATVLTGILE